MSRVKLSQVDTETSINAREKSHSRNKHHQPETCPECHGKIILDELERVCESCGLVVEEKNLDRGPEWRADSSAERDEKARCGAPITEAFHDKGLTTEIDWRDRDAKGNYLNASQRERARKNRFAQQRSKVTGREESHRDGRGEIDRMGSALGIKEPTKTCACKLYGQAVDRGLLPGWSRETVATAALHITLEQVGKARDIEEILPVSHADKTKILRSRKQIIDELGLQASVIADEDELREEISQHIRRLVSNAGGKHVIERAAISLLEETDYEQLGNGRKPMSYAAAYVFYAGQLVDSPKSPTQKQLHEAGGPCEKTIRTARNALKENIGSESVEEILSTMTDPDM